MAAELRVLGPVAVVGDDGAVSLPAKHARLLAALVIASGRALGVDELVEAVWNGTAPASARKLVQVYVSQLRKTLPAGCAITTRGSAYAIELAPDVLDATRFERLLDEARDAAGAENAALALSLAERALSLWRGRAYGELAYEEFARAESERLEELRLVAVEERLAAGLELGRHDELLGEVLAHASENPYREHGHELAMLALYRSGRPTDALDHFASVRTRLDDELGLEPGQRLRELQRRILQQDPTLELAAAVTATAAALPVPPNPLVGRERELAELRALLERRESRLVVLTGAGGSGKTRLALEVARQVARSYANGVALVELAPLRDPALVVPTIAQALDVLIDTDRDQLAAVADTVGGREFLLVVDNAEHLRQAAPAYAELVARVPRLTLLVTSRAVLHVSGEKVFPVAPLAEDAAVELFVQRAHLLDPSFELTSDNEPDVREICRRVDCLPLAVELAAARIRTLTPRALMQRLDVRLSVLTGGPRDVPARQQTLRETIAWSAELLDGRERAVLARLAVCPAGATLEAAEQVCGADLDVLAALVDDHLILRDEVDGEPRFDMLETIREYALELLGDERAKTELTLAEYFADVADELRLSAPVEDEWRRIVQRLDPEADNLRVALGAAEASGDTELLVRLAGGLYRYWYTRGPLVEGLEWIGRALDAAPGPATAARACALQGAAALAELRGDRARAKLLARAAVSVAVEAGSTWDELTAHTILGIVANEEGDRVIARCHHQRALELKELLGLEPLAQKLNLGVVALDSREYEEALALFQDVLDVHRRNDNPRGMAFALCNVGLVRYELGDREASRRDFEEARACAERAGLREQLGSALQGLAAAEAGDGRYEEAARLLGQARSELDDLGRPEDLFAPEMHAATEAQVRAALGNEAFEAAYAAGREGSA